jgi:hypothetical protein
MHTRHPRLGLRFVLMGLLIGALIVLFPITARSHQDVIQLALAVL